MIEYSIEPSKVILSDEQIATIQNANNKLNGDEEHDHYVMLALMQALAVYGDDVMHLYEYLVEADSDMRSEYDNDIDGFYEDQIPNQLAAIDEAVIVLEKILEYPSNQDYIDGLVIFEEDEDDE
jgi:hypoxanthine-guanine phosphoribosyltransferase